MKSFYLDENRNMMVRELSKKEIQSELLNQIKSVILELDVAHENYNSATGGLVDYYSYRIKAAQSKYDYLLKLIKDMNINQYKKTI